MGLCGGGQIKETEYEKMLGQVAAEKWDITKRLYKPLEGRYRDKMKSQSDVFGDAGRTNKAMRIATKSRGLDIQDINNQTRKAGTAVGSAVAGGVMASKDRARAGLENIIRLGRNIDSLGTRNIASEARTQYASAKADAYSKADQQAGMANLIGTGIGYRAGKPKKDSSFEQDISGYQINYGEGLKRT